MLSVGSEKTNRELQPFIATQLRRPLDKVKTMTLQTILDAVRNEKLSVGCLECDIHVPEHLRHKFSEMLSCIQKHRAIPR